MVDIPEGLRPLRILLVEDSPDHRLLVEHYLKKTPYTIDMAENGEVAVGRFTKGEYDLVLMDMQMPVMDGYTASTSIREWEARMGAKPTPVVALTASALIDAERKSLDAGCDGHIYKPIKKAGLFSAIVQYTNGASNP